METRASTACVRTTAGPVLTQPLWSYTGTVLWLDDLELSSHPVHTNGKLRVGSYGWSGHVTWGQVRKGLSLVCPPLSDANSHALQSALTLCPHCQVSSTQPDSLCSAPLLPARFQYNGKSFPPAVTDSNSNKLPNSPAGNPSHCSLSCCLLIPKGSKI